MSSKPRYSLQPGDREGKGRPIFQFVLALQPGDREGRPYISVRTSRAPATAA